MDLSHHQFFFIHGATAPVGQCLLTIVDSRSQTQHTRKDSSGRAISLTQRPQPDSTQNSQETDIHAPGRIRTHNPSKRAAADPRLRLGGHWDQHRYVLG
jgi:hypothetical protein